MNSIRIVTVDSYMSPPHPELDVLNSEFRGSSIPQVPILRIFGSTDKGEKICVHIHGVFPYLYIPFDGVGNTNSTMYQIAASIDKAVNVSLGQASSNMQHVYKICLVSGTPFYGFHSKKHQFFKIYLYNPLLVRKVSNLLQNEAILGKIYQPHESHVPFTLQFMIDYNLHGMSTVNLSEMKYRYDPNKNTHNTSHKYLPQNIPKITTCELEADASAEHIVNRLDVITGKIAVNPGIAAIWEDERQRKRNKNEDSLIAPCLTLTENYAKPTHSHVIFKRALQERLILVSSEKENVENTANISVYPAESPNDLNLADASLVDFQTPDGLSNESSLNLSLDSTLISSQLNNTLDLTIDADVQNLLDVLKDLGENAKDVEEDSILSQVPTKKDEIEEFDLSLPLSAIATPVKINIYEKEDSGEDDSLNTTFIPQVDGCFDELKTNSNDELLLTCPGEVEFEGKGHKRKNEEMIDQNMTFKKLKITIEKMDFSMIDKKSKKKKKKSKNKAKSTKYVINVKRKAPYFKIKLKAPISYWENYQMTAKKKVESRCNQVKTKKIGNSKTRKLKSLKTVEEYAAVLEKQNLRRAKTIEKYGVSHIVLRSSVKKSSETNLLDNNESTSLEKTLTEDCRKHSINKTRPNKYEQKTIHDTATGGCSQSFVSSTKQIKNQRRAKTIEKYGVSNIVSRRSVKKSSDSNLLDNNESTSLEKTLREDCMKPSINKTRPNKYEQKTIHDTATDGCSQSFVSSTKQIKNQTKRNKKTNKTTKVKKPVKLSAKKMNNKLKLNKIINRINDQEHDLNELLQNGVKPKFSITSRKNLRSGKKSKPNLVQPYIMNVIVKYPTEESYMYRYNGDLEPQVVELTTQHVFKEKSNAGSEIDRENDDDDGKKCIYLNSYKYLQDIVEDETVKNIQKQSFEELSSTIAELKKKFSKSVLESDPDTNNYEENLVSNENEENNLINETLDKECCNILQNPISDHCIKSNDRTRLKKFKQNTRKVSSATKSSVPTTELIKNNGEGSISKINRSIDEGTKTVKPPTKKKKKVKFNKIIDVIDIHEHNPNEIMQNGVKPKFNHKSVKTRSEKKSQTDTTQPYPKSANIIVQYPSKETYFYHYNGAEIPQVVNLKISHDNKTKSPICKDTIHNDYENNQNVGDMEFIYLNSYKYLQDVVEDEIVMNVRKKSFEELSSIFSEVNMIFSKSVTQPDLDAKRHEKKLLPNANVNNNSILINKNWARNCYNSMKFTYFSLDGTCDSSSSDNDEALYFNETESSNSSRKKRVSPRYKALPISVESPGNTRSPFAPGSSNRPVSVKANKTQENVENPLMPAKRQLVFDITPLPNATLIEEHLICNLRSKHSKLSSQNLKPNRLNCETAKAKSSKTAKGWDLLNTSHYVNNKNVTLSAGEKSTESVIILSQHKSCFDNTSQHQVEVINEELDKTNSLLQQESKESCQQLYNDTSLIQQIKHSNLTISEKYDIETNYLPIEGTSKNSKIICSSSSSNTSISQIEKKPEVLTNSAGSSSDFLLSQKSIQHNNSSISHLDQLSQTSHVNNASSGFDVSTNRSLKAPTCKEILDSLDVLKIAHEKHLQPFYSNNEDVSGMIEVGHNILKITSNCSVHQPEFESVFDSLNKLRKMELEKTSSNFKWTKTYVDHVKLTFCSNRDCVITPIKRPPTRYMINKWLKEKSAIRKVVEQKKVEKKKIFIPLTPINGGDDEDAIDLSLSLSPCSPPSSLNSSQIVCTPKSSQNSPVLGANRKRIKQIKNKFSSQVKSLSDTTVASLRRSDMFSQESLNRSGQITGVSLNNTYGFKKSIENYQEARALSLHQYLTILVMELHIKTRGDFKPNPEYDPICSLFYSIKNDVPENHVKPAKIVGIIAVKSSFSFIEHPTNCEVSYVDSENELIEEFAKMILHWDPDIFGGYEIEMLSWGYLMDRAYVLGINILPLLSRTKDNHSRHKDGEELRIPGRIILDVWRLMRHEIALQSYTFESVVYHILQKRVPMYSFKDLSYFWSHKSATFRHRTINYYLTRVEYILDLLDKLDLIGRTSELARLFGIQFYEVLSRGSQFRVESMMLRLAKPLNFIPVSPSVQQRAKMKAPEFLPLILEPESKLYVDPVIVLDFQSLYPSMIIAYNYCFSTCLGRVEHLGKNLPFEFGATQLKVSRNNVEKLLKKDLLNFSPCGVAYVKNKVRDGILPRMLREILDTRLMVKKSMKENKNNSVLQKVLHNRQLGLKLIANVTYGYTAANFSGRMPSVEIADSVLSKGRETLQRAIAMVDNTPEWNARVVYGDTDSLFVMVPGRSREYAFEVGKKIADAVTNDNPNPVKLKLEKVYQPCILQTKKRYVGYMYESPDQKEPTFDAKGIETVRRDGCPAVPKMLEKCLKLLFDTKDISLVKKYVLRQFNKILAGRVSIQDLTFSKEYRGASGYRPGACVPALELARKWTSVDKRNEPRSKERVPYIIVNGPPGLPLIKLVRSPRDLLGDSSLRPNALYYITKVIIPPINRCFNLIGVDLNNWFNQMPRKQIQYLPTSSPGKKSTISQYFSTTNCVVCATQTKNGICEECLQKQQQTVVTITEKIRKWETNHYDVSLICRTCTGSHDITCISLDCPVLYRRSQTNRDLQQTSYLRQLMVENELIP